MKVNLSVPCEFTDEQVEGAVMAMLKHQPMTGEELRREFSVPCWDSVNNALTRLLDENKVRQQEGLTRFYFIRSDYKVDVNCPYRKNTICSNSHGANNPLYPSDVKRCPECGRLLDE